jgi:hypothetical protein
MISSTFFDLAQHRHALIEALQKQELFPISMENYVVSPDDNLISSSLTMVHKSSGYIGLIGHRFGQIVTDEIRNPQMLSITQMEFEEAGRLGLPSIVFVMGDDHPVRKSDIETDEQKLAKLAAFKESAKLGRIYVTFDSLEDFKYKAIHAVASLRRFLEESRKGAGDSNSVKPSESAEPPLTHLGFHAVPAYIGSHQFVGRKAQLETLNEWASPADAHPVLLFEAIGGAGKSMLTWEWAKNRSGDARSDWRGRFWYSFYERGATMNDFCRRALAYMTGRSWTLFRESSTFELSRQLMDQLRTAPWLLVLDGLERVLVSYHRLDAPQLRDEDAGSPDQIARRHPCSAINPEDDELLRGLSGAMPSKLLLTTRLAPRALLNHSNQPIPGVLREHLPGLRPHDAELLIRSCGVSGTPSVIQTYLKSHCDCHPLVIGVLAGLVNDFLQDRGSFDSWVMSESGGGRLNLADLDLVQKRNHIMAAALSALPDTSHELLSTMALLSESFDYETISSIDPSLSPMPEDTSLLSALSEQPAELSPKERKRLTSEFKDRLAEAIQRRGSEIAIAAPRLSATIRDLESRGLLQYDSQTQRYDLHPVVRGIAAGGLRSEERDRYGQRVVDYFSRKSADPYEDAQEVGDLDNARNIVSALLQMNRVQAARAFVLRNSFLQILNFRFEAHNEVLAILRPFFPEGWHAISGDMEEKGGVSLARRASNSLRRIGAHEEAFAAAMAAFNVDIKRGAHHSLVSHLLGLASCAGELNRLKLEDRLLELASEAGEATGTRIDRAAIAVARFRNLSLRGQFDAAESLLPQIGSIRTDEVSRSIVSHHRVLNLFLSDRLSEQAISDALEVNAMSKSALGVRNLTALAGLWHLDRSENLLARERLVEAIRLAHKVGKLDRRSELRLVIARLRLSESVELEGVPSEVTEVRDKSCLLDAAGLWFAAGRPDTAAAFASAAYVWASSDGDPHTRAYDVRKASRLLAALAVQPPTLPARATESICPLAFENAALHAIERLKTRRRGGAESTGLKSA